MYFCKLNNSGFKTKLFSWKNCKERLKKAVMLGLSYSCLKLLSITKWLLNDHNTLLNSKSVPITNAHNAKKSNNFFLFSWNWSRLGFVLKRKLTICFAVVR
ncbi:hypothetical protein [Mycoplasmoides genitalium]|uniref:hypothetical protein n=1 Tax=Mycoplasmoides genitalium TaxID=2097 RepID=UPI0005A1F849|nr:hypothetical protein [Mycoplasmoides genitalium]